MLYYTLTSLPNCPNKQDHLTTRKDARQDVFDYIEFFYNPKRKHGNNGLLSPIDFEKQTIVKMQGV